MNYRVARKGKADFRSLGEALEGLAGMPENPGSTTLSIGAGTYREKLRVMVPRLRLVGEGADCTLLSWDDHAARLLPSGDRMNTFNSYTLYVGAEGFFAEGLTIENSAGDGREKGQAIACYVDADGAVFSNCAIRAHQDTLFLGPLPDNPLPKGINLIHPVRFAGREGPRGPQRSLFKNCTISGDVDFIFGSGQALFEGCTLVSLDRGEKVNGYIAAPSTLPGQKAGFVFIDCSLESEAQAGTVFLGRPWRRSAKAAFIRCRMQAHIVPQGWDNWRNPENESTAEFLEWDNSGPGNAPESRPAWIRGEPLSPGLVESLQLIRAPGPNE
jgi:pectinesterase